MVKKERVNVSHVPLQKDTNVTLRERLRIHKCPTKDQCFYLKCFGCVLKSPW